MCTLYVCVEANIVVALVVSVPIGTATAIQRTDAFLVLLYFFSFFFAAIDLEEEG